VRGEVLTTMRYTNRRLPLPLPFKSGALTTTLPRYSVIVSPCPSGLLKDKFIVLVLVLVLDTEVLVLVLILGTAVLVLVLVLVLDTIKSWCWFWSLRNSPWLCPCDYYFCSLYADKLHLSLSPGDCIIADNWQANQKLAGCDRTSGGDTADQFQRTYKPHATLCIYLK